MQTFRRSLAVGPLEVTGRVLEGIALRWNRAYRVSDDRRRWYSEGWRPGAFTRGLAATGNVHEARLDHRDIRVGRVTFAEGEHGLGFTATADETPGGDLLLALNDQRKLRGVSLTFASDRQQTDDGVVWRTRATARELSFLERTRPQYDDAVITSRRGDLDDALDDALDQLSVYDSLENEQRRKQVERLLARSAANLTIDVTSL
jgi:HK97 family phage prohead protease